MSIARLDTTQARMRGPAEMGNVSSFPVLGDFRRQKTRESDTQRCHTCSWENVVEKTEEGIER